MPYKNKAQRRHYNAIYQAGHYQRNRQAYIVKAKAHNNKYRERARAYIERLKEEGKCELCGEDDPRTLVFDHVRGKKIFSIGDAVRKALSMRSLQREIAKCRLICANCHAKHHDGMKWEKSCAPPVHTEIGPFNLDLFED